MQGMAGEVTENFWSIAYERMLVHFGPQHWWPADTPFEVLVGAVLTQNTSWKNVALAIGQLRDAGLLQYDLLSACDPTYLAELIRPSGYYNLKARRLGNLLKMIAENYQGDFDLFLSDEKDMLRERLLEVKGVGPETADSIILYACEQPAFVVDAYTYRVVSRHCWVPEEMSYDELQALFVDALPVDVQLYNEYHALIVKLATTYCKKTKPLCEHCPLQGLRCD